MRIRILERKCAQYARWRSRISLTKWTSRQLVTSPFCVHEQLFVSNFCKLFQMMSFQKRLVLMQFCWSGSWRIRICRLVLRNSGWKPSTPTQIAYFPFFFVFTGFGLKTLINLNFIIIINKSTKKFFFFYFIWRKILFFEFTKHKILNMERRDSSCSLFLS